jgi:hypothetical protein
MWERNVGWFKCGLGLGGSGTALRVEFGVGAAEKGRRAVEENCRTEERVGSRERENRCPGNRGTGRKDGIT